MQQYGKQRTYIIQLGSTWSPLKERIIIDVFSSRESTSTKYHPENEDDKI